jgi:hypothetical protein
MAAGDFQLDVYWTDIQEASKLFINNGSRIGTKDTFKPVDFWEIYEKGYRVLTELDFGRFYDLNNTGEQIARGSLKVDKNLSAGETLSVGYNKLAGQDIDFTFKDNASVVRGYIKAMSGSYLGKVNPLIVSSTTPIILSGTEVIVPDALADGGAVNRLFGDGRYAQLTELQKGWDASKERTGWEDNANITVTYDAVARTVTITHPTRLRYFWKGNYTDLGTSWTSTAHDDTPELWLLYSTDGINFTWSNTIWEFWDVMIFGAKYWSSTDYISLREVHGLIEWNTHEDIHTLNGTFRSTKTLDGGTVNGYVLDSSTEADRRPGATQVILKDEDIETLVTALAAGGPYSHIELANATEVGIAKNELEIVHLSGTSAQYQDPTTGVWSNIGNQNYANLYLMAIPATAEAEGQKVRWMWWQPQASYNTASGAHLEDFLLLNKADLNQAVAEFIPVARVTIKAVTSYFELEQITPIYGSRASFAGVPAPAQTTATNVSFTPVGTISSTDVQAAIGELDSEVSGNYVSKTSATAQTMVGMLSASKVGEALRIGAGGTAANNYIQFNQGATDYGYIGSNLADNDVRIVSYLNRDISLIAGSGNINAASKISGTIASFTGKVDFADPTLAQDGVTLSYANANYLGLHAKADDSLDSDKLGGELPSFYATATDLDSYVRSTNSGTETMDGNLDMVGYVKAGNFMAGEWPSSSVACSVGHENYTTLFQSLYIDSGGAIHTARDGQDLSLRAYNSDNDEDARHTISHATGHVFTGVAEFQGALTGTTADFTEQVTCFDDLVVAKNIFSIDTSTPSNVKYNFSGWANGVYNVTLSANGATSQAVTLLVTVGTNDSYTLANQMGAGMFVIANQAISGNGVFEISQTGVGVITVDIKALRLSEF